MDFIGRAKKMLCEWHQCDLLPQGCLPLQEVMANALSLAYQAGRREGIEESAKLAEGNIIENPDSIFEDDINDHTYRIIEDIRKNIPEQSSHVIDNQAMVMCEMLKAKYERD